MIDPQTQEQIVDPETRRPIVDPAAVEQRAEEIRARLAPRPQAGQIKTPDSIIQDLEYAKWAAAQSPAIIRDADRAVRVLQRRYARLFSAQVKKSESKAADERRLEAEVVLEEHLVQLDAAEVALEYAKRVAKSVEASTSAIQTQAAQVRITYELAGTGRGQ